MIRLLFLITYIAILLPASIGLMETSFALLVAGVGIYLLTRSKPTGFAFLAIAVYLRIELLILLTLTAILYIFQKQYKLQVILGYIAVGLLPFVIYDLYFFHTIVPQSIVAKSIVYSLPWFVPAVVVLLFSFPPSLLFDHMIGLVFLGTILLSTVLFTSMSALKEWKAQKFYWPVLFGLWSILIAGGYIFRRAYVFDWYMPLYTIPLLIACYLCLIAMEHSRKIIITSLISSIFIVSALSFMEITYSGIYAPGYFRLFSPGSHVKTYRYVGEILNEEYPNATLLTSEIGGLGYSFSGKIMDAAGLASPDALKYHPMEVPEQRASGDNGAIPPGYVKETSPDLIVTYDCFAQALLSDDIIKQYNVILIPPYLPEDAQYSQTETIWNCKALHIYIHKGLPISEKIYAIGK